MSGMGGGAQSSIDYYEAEGREDVCVTCGGTGELGPDGRSVVAYELSVGPCYDCGGSGEEGRPPPHYLDGDYLRDARDGF